MTASGDDFFGYIHIYAPNSGISGQTAKNPVVSLSGTGSGQVLAEGWQRNGGNNPPWTWTYEGEPGCYIS